MVKIIHQIWIGPYKIPKLVEYFSKIMKEKKPDFEYMLWTNIKIYGMKLLGVCAFKSIKILNANIYI